MDKYRPDWMEVRVDIMEQILREKLRQHAYVVKKLRVSGDARLIEGSWRDGFWGIGEDGEGQNVLGNLWMKLRGELPELSV